MTRRQRSEADANRHLASTPRPRARQPKAPTWSLPVTTALKAVGALLAVLVVLDLAGVL